MRTEASSSDKGRKSGLRRTLGWVQRGLLWLVVVLLVLAAAGTVYQAVATEIEQQSMSSSPGALVAVGGHRLHINCVGEGNPTVVLEAGGGYTSVEWSAWVQPEVAGYARVCAYDRAGTGWSEPDSESMDTVQVTNDLHALLSNAGEEGPYILVGHSLGSLYSRVYADRFPEDVAGMVLVDSSHPDQFERLGLESALTANRVAGVVGPPLAWIGVPRLFGLFPPSPDLPLLQREQIDSFHYQTPYLVAAFEELGAIPKALEQARKMKMLGDKPLAVVSAADHGAEALADSEEGTERIEREAQVLQEEFTALSSDSTRRVVEGSTHESLVVDEGHARQTAEEVVRVVEAVRAGRRVEKAGAGATDTSAAAETGLREARPKEGR